jgi:hypothetical protein
MTPIYLLKSIDGSYHLPIDIAQKKRTMNMLLYYFVCMEKLSKNDASSGPWWRPFRKAGAKIRQLFIPTK